MLDELKVILNIQDFDMKMIRLMLLKKERQNELDHIHSLKKDLQAQLLEKKEGIEELDKQIVEHEARIEDSREKIKKLDAKQSTVKKVDEFNALTKEMSTTERARVAIEQATSDLIDKKALEEEILNKIEESLVASKDSSKALEQEIANAIKLINEEGKGLQEQRKSLASTASPDVLKIYNRLLKNKKDRVVVPIENRSCSGCHISLTAQHENLVRRGERLVYCEHCSRIHYWQESEVVEGTTAMTKKRRRRTTSV